MSSSAVIAVDVGGSTLKSGLVEAPGRLRGEVTLTPIDSNGSREEILDLLCDVLRVHGEIGRVGFGFPGPFDYGKGVCLMEGVAKYGELFEVDLSEELARRLGRTPSFSFRNDAEAALVGEALYGSAKSYTRVFGLCLGSGCGSAFLVDGRPQTRGDGIPANGWVYPLLFQGERADDRFSIRGLRRRFAAVGFEGDIPQAAQQACSGNLALLESWMTFGRELGEFCFPLCRDFGADALLVLGGIAGAADLFTPHMALDVPVLQGRLGRSAALFGAAQPFFEESL